MKKRKLLLAAALLFCTAGVWAQTDVTNTYITNAGFEGAYTRFYDINDDRGCEKPVGWSVEWSQDNNDTNGMTYVGSMTQDSKTWNAYEGEKAYLSRMRWANATLNLRQTMSNLRPGSYTLSFYATASKLSSGNGTASVSVAGQTQSITVGTSENTEWTQYTINFTVTTNPYATIEVTASRTAGNFKFGIDDFTLAYDGSSYYSTILDAAQALHDDNKDWAEGADDLSTAIIDATGKETVADKNAAIFALEEAMATFKETNTVDVTSRITNATFDSNISSWTTTGGDGNAYQWNNSSQTNFSGGFLEKWRNGWNGGYNQKNFDVYQTLSSLPNGEYTIKAAIIAVMQGSKESKQGAYQNKKHGGPYYIDDDHGVWLYGTSGETTAKAWANTKNSNFDGDGAEYKTATVKVENGSLTIGFKGIGSESGGTSLGTYANWIACDNWTLSYFGFDPTTLKSQISDLKDDVQDLIDGDEVPTAVKTSLQNTLDNLVETPETKTILNAAVSTLETAISAANATKSAYAAALAHIDFVTEEKTNSTGEKATLEEAISTATETIETRTTAADLESDMNILETARQTYVLVAKPTAGHVFDYTFKISDATVTGSGNWSNKGTANGQQYTDAPDNKYMDCGWNSTYQSYQTVSDLPAGYYTLKAATRARESEVSSANIYVNQERSELNRSKDNHRDGSTGGELGNGWSWTEVDFELRATGNVSVGFYAKTTGQGWAGADDFHLYYKGNAVADDVAETLKGTVVSGKMNATVDSEQSSALSTFESAQTIENYEALEVAIAAANASKDAYTAANEKLTAMKAVIDATNVYTTDALNTYYTTPKGKYDDNSLTDEEAAALQNPSTQTGWHADITVDNFLLSSWNTAPDFDEENSPYYINTWSTEGNSDGSGMTTPFFEYFVDNGNDAKLAGRTLTATIEDVAEGNYYVDVLVRVYKNSGADETATGITLDINGGSPVDICTGTAGANNCFYGTFRALGAVDGSGVLNININVAGENNVHWLAFKNVMYSVFNGATSEQKDALASAISNAEGKTLGFSDGEYAPYNNIDVLTALADAKALNTETATATEVTDATAAIGDANWTVNDGDVDAIYNGNFAEANGTNPKGWTRSNGAWGQQITKLTTETNGVAEGTTTAWYYNTEGAWEYGKDGAYTMPLAENQAYKLTFKYRSHAEGTNNWLKASVLNESLVDVLTGDGVIFAKNADATMFVTATAYFTTGAAGNHVLILHNSGNTHLTDVSLVKVDPATFELSDNTTYEAADRTYYQTLTLKRTIKAEKWNTFCVPFDMTAEEITSQLGTGTEVKKLTGATQNGDHYTLTFDDALIEDALTIEAGKPYMVKVPSDDVTSISLSNKITKEAITRTTVGDVTFTGTYTSGNAPMGSFIISNNKFYEVNSEVALKAFRGYITVASSSPVKALNFEFEDDATSINEELRVKNEESAGAVYDLSGRRINSQSSILNGQLPKGIYIVNGEKVLK